MLNKDKKDGNTDVSYSLEEVIIRKQNLSGSSPLSEELGLGRRERWGIISVLLPLPLLFLSSYATLSRFYCDRERPGQVCLASMPPALHQTVWEPPLSQASPSPNSLLGHSSHVHHDVLVRIRESSMALIHKEKKKVFVTDKIPFLVFIYENQ